MLRTKPSDNLVCYSLGTGEKLQNRSGNRFFSGFFFSFLPQVQVDAGPGSIKKNFLGPLKSNMTTDRISPAIQQ